MEPAEGRVAIRDFIAGSLAGCDGIDFTVHRQIARGNLVMNERTDAMQLKNGRQVALPVMGISGSATDASRPGDTTSTWRR